MQKVMETSPENPSKSYQRAFFFLFLKTRTAPSTQGMSYGCNTIKVPDYNGQSKQEERNLNKYVELSSTRAKNERKKGLISRIECSQLSKLIAFCSCHIHHIMQCGTTHKPPNNYIAQPLSKQFNDPLRHSPMDTKQAKHHYPQLISYRAMKKKVIYWFHTLFAHTTPVYHNNSLLPMTT